MGYGQPQQPPPAGQSFDDTVVELLRNDRMRGFLIDIETDSTIQPDEDAEKQRRTEFITALSGFLQQAAPIVQATPAITPMITELLLFGVRGYRVARSMEDVIERTMQAVQQQVSQPRPNPEAEQMQAEMQMKQVEAQQKQADNQAKLEIEYAKLEIEKQRLQMDLMKIQAEMELKQQEAIQDLQLKRAEADLKAQIAQTEANQKLMQEQMKAEQEQRALAEKAQIETQTMRDKASLDLQNTVAANAAGLEHKDAEAKQRLKHNDAMHNQQLAQSEADAQAIRPHRVQAEKDKAKAESERASKPTVFKVRKRDADKRATEYEVN